MGIIFGKKKKPAGITEQDRAILQLKDQRDKIKQYQRRIEATLNNHRELAKQLLQENRKERAKLLLRKKRYQEQLLVKTDQQLETLERLTHDLEFAQVEIRVVEGLKLGNEALKKVNDILKIEDIERILDETREGAEKQQEINALLSGNLTEEDEEAVEDELNKILEEQLPNIPAEEIPAAGTNDKLPDVPTHAIKEITKEKQPREAVALEA
ncbi:charged multivesicular body protein 6-A [Agrilus planipennis]|uniref:Charged multivesicular body protein 6-A n=1 Tax=Agrilus planipennis TaxID=224129 RepID=A0A1W4WGC5_AGRPL|nr:charged multivesicular body protein 6-A [Agrilus planipennis]